MRESALKLARRVLVPKLQLTTVVSQATPGAVEIVVPAAKDNASQTYYAAPKMELLGGFRRDGQPIEVPHEFLLFPLVIGGNDVPWAEANMWLLSMATQRRDREMTTISGNADDLAAYLRFLEEARVDWTLFPANKLQRPTYRFHAHLKPTSGSWRKANRPIHRQSCCENWPATFR